VVHIVANRFEPETTTICAGDVVEWRNEDSKEHTIVTGTPTAPDGTLSSPKIYFGGAWSHQFTEPGEFMYFCSTHKKQMRDAVVVVR